MIVLVLLICDSPLPAFVPQNICAADLTYLATRLSACTMASSVELRTGDYTSDRKPQFTTSTDVEVENGVIGEIVETRRIQQKFGMLRKARELEELMDRKLGVESQVRARLVYFWEHKPEQNTYGTLPRILSDF